MIFKKNRFMTSVVVIPSLYRTLILTVSISLIAVSTAAYAALDNVPGSDTAGGEQQRFQEQKKTETRVQALKRATDQEEKIGEENVFAEEGGKTFRLNSIVITGNTSIPSAELEKTVDSWTGKTVSFGDLKKIASRLKQYYREKKFIAAYVYVPPQKVSDGVVEFKVIEGKLGSVEIDGEKWFSEKAVRRELGLKEGKVVYFQDLNQGLGDLNKNPDIKGRAVLQPGVQPETTDIVFKIKDKFPLHVNAEVNNLGTVSTGRTRWGVGVTHNNLTGHMDTLSARFQMGTGAWAVGTRYSADITPYDTNLGLSYSRSAVHLGRDFRDLNIRGDATTYGVDLLQPFFRNAWVQSAATLGFDIKSIQNKILGVKAGKDELRILNAGLNFEQNDRFGRTYMPHTFHFGFSDFLGASDVNETAATRAGTGGQFFIYRTSLIRYTRLPKGGTHTFRTDIQLTPDRLAPSEQFRLGGAFSVRGYSEGDYLADFGGLVINEVSIPSYMFPADWVLPYSGEPLRQAIQGVVFFDFGAGGLRSPFEGERRHKMLAGAGGGVRIHIYDRVFARFQWAGRLGHKGTDGANSVFYYGVSAET